MALLCAACGFESPEGFRHCGGCGAAVGAEPGAPRAYTPPHLAERILRSRSVLEGERKEVTVLFVDVKDSMELAAALGAEAWHATLDRLLPLLAEGVHRAEGTVNQYTGDGVMALFGAPIAHEDHARRACHAALDIAQRLEPFAEGFHATHDRELHVRMGLHSGEVVVGRIGDDLRMDYTAQGHVVGIAARVQQLAEAGTICITDAVLERAGGYFRTRPLGDHTLAGADAPVGLHELSEELAGRTRLDLAAERGLPPLVGRRESMASLGRALDSAREARGLVLGVSGDAGVGKSRLCTDFAARVRGDGEVAVLEVHCPSHASTMPRFAMRELVRALLPPDEQEPLLERLEREADATDVGRDLASLVVARAAKEPVLLLIDDCHWIDAESDAFLELLVGALATRRALLLVNFRPEYRASWMSAAGYRELGLRPLGRDATVELVRALVGDHPSTRGLARSIRVRAQGNPLFVEELLRSLRAAERLVGEPGQLELTGSVDDLVVPETLRALIAARIDRLAEADKRTLQRAAVVGKRFGEALLARVGTLEGEALHESLRRLQRAELVRRERPPYFEDWCFEHPLTREVAYDSLLGAQRARIHDAAAEALVESGERLGERAGWIADHYERAGRDHAAHHWRQRAAFQVTNIVPRRRGRDRRS